MAKECPSCNADCRNVYQCDRCGHMFCEWCGRSAFFSGGPIAMSGCPVCEPSFWGPFQTKVSVDDDDSKDSFSDDEGENTSSDEETKIDEISYSSSDDSGESSYSSPGSSSSSGGGEGIIAFVVIGALAVLIFVAVTASLDERHRKISTNQVNQPPQIECTGISPDGTSCYAPDYGGWVARNAQGQVVRVPPPPGTQKPRNDSYFFQNTLPGTYSMGKNQDQVE